MIRTLSYITLLLLLTAAGLNDARKANKAYEAGNYEEAEQLYLDALEQNPNNARLYFNLGNAQAKQGKVEEAIESFMEFRNRAETTEDKSLADYNIGTMMAEGKKWKPAAAHFKNALTLNPTDLEAKHNYERAMIELQKEDQDKKQQKKNNEKPPKPSAYALAMKKQAEKLVAEHKYEEAYNLMQRALKVDETVRAFNDFMDRTKSVSTINTP